MTSARVLCPVAMVSLVWTAALGRAAYAGEGPPAHVISVEGLAPGERRPLVVYLHGLGGSGAEAIANPAIRGWAQAARVFLVAPDGAADRIGRRFWNAGGACCNFDRRPGDDVGRLEALIDHWRARPDIDPDQVFVIGFSNGGFMAHRLACWMDDRLAGIASISGAGRAPEEACGVTTRLTVVEVHGDADPIVRYQGGRVFDSRELDPHPAAAATIRDWATRFGCAASQAGKATTKTTQVDLDPAQPGPETAIESWRCGRGEAELWTVRGGGHALVTGPIIERVGARLLSHSKSAVGGGGKSAAKRSKK